MSALAELLPVARSLSRVDKARLIQLLADDLAAGEGGRLQDGATYEVWSPDSAFEAAKVLHQMLAEEDRS